MAAAVAEGAEVGETHRRQAGLHRAGWARRPRGEGRGGDAQPS
jgi:hypothetical protein